MAHRPWPVRAALAKPSLACILLEVEGAAAGRSDATAKRAAERPTRPCRAESRLAARSAVSLQKGRAAPARVGVRLAAQAKWEEEEEEEAEAEAEEEGEEVPDGAEVKARRTLRAAARSAGQMSEAAVAVPSACPTRRSGRSAGFRPRRRPAQAAAAQRRAHCLANDAARRRCRSLRRRCTAVPSSGWRCRGPPAAPRSPAQAMVRMEMVVCQDEIGGQGGRGGQRWECRRTSFFAMSFALPS